MESLDLHPLVLLAEADALIAMDLGEVLESEGYRVLGPFAKAADALARIERETPNLAIIDTLLKDGPSIELARELRQRGIPVLIHSVHRPDGSLAPDFQTLPWVTKPALPEDVVALCDELFVSAPTLPSTKSSPVRIAPARSVPQIGDSGNPFIRKLEGLATLSEEDRAVLQRITAEHRVVPARTDLVREGSKPDGVFVVMDGFVCRHKYQPDGQRQIMAYLLPGDFCDLDVALLETMDHTLTTISACSVVHIRPQTIAELVEHHPRIARALRMTTLVDEATLREWLVNIGCRSALGRMAHLFCELFVRLRAVGLAAENRYAIPLTQTNLGDTTGLTTVHVNRTLQEMRRQGLIELKGGQLTILDMPRLKKVGGFKPNYLHLRERIAA